MRKFFKGFRQFSTLLVTLMVMGGFFAYYFVVIVYQNEADLKERNFRGLYSISDNIHDKIDNYIKQNAKNFLEKINQEKNDSTNKTPMETRLRQVRDRFGLREDFIPDADDSDLNRSQFFVENNQGWKIYFKPDLKKDSVAYTDFTNFVRPVLRDDLFDQYIVVKDRNIIFTKTTSALNPKSIDSLFNKNKLQTDVLRDVEVGGSQYKLFLAPVALQGNQRWMIGGLMPVADYRHYKMYIPDNFILVIMFGILLILLSLPFIKTLLMNNEDRLNSEDVLFSFVSFNLISALLVIGIWDAYSYVAIQCNGANQKLDAFSNEISTSFQSEVDSVIVQLNDADSILKNYVTNNIRDDSALDLVKVPISKTKKVNAGNGGIPFQPSAYPYFSNIAWSSGDGNQRVRWTTESFLPNKINLSSRDYFSRVMSNALWNRSEKDTFYLDEIASYTANKTLAVVSKPSHVFNAATKESLKVISLTAPLKSVFKTIVPYGFGFCIIDSSGRALFHVDYHHNLNENFLHETGDNNILISAMKSQNASYFDASYYGTDYHFKVVPLKDMPYYLVTYRNLNQLRSENTEIVTTTTLLAFIQIFFICFVTTVIQFLRYRPGKLRNKKLQLTWLMPQERLSNSYLQVTSCNLVVFPVMIAIACLNNPVLTLTVIFSSTMLLLMFSFYFLGVKGNFSHHTYMSSWNPLSFFNRNHSQWAEKIKLWEPLLGLLGLYLFFSIATMIQIQSWLIFFLVQVVIWIGFFVIKNADRFFEKVQWFQLLQKRYAVAQVTYLLVTAIVPACLFFQMVFNEETTRFLKYQQTDFAKRYSGTPALLVNTGFENYYYKPMADSLLFVTGKNVAGSIKEKSAMDVFHHLYEGIRPDISDFNGDTREFDADTSNDGTLKWNTNGKYLQLTYKDFRTNSRIPHDSTLLLKSDLAYLKWPGLNASDTDVFPSWIFLLEIITFLIFLVSFMNYFTKRIFFGIDANIGRMRVIDEKLLTSTDNDKHLFVIGLPNSGKRVAITKMHADQKFSIFDIDFADTSIDDVWAKAQNNLEYFLINSDQKKLVLLHHFEYNSSDAFTNKKKLLLLERLLKIKPIRIIVLSTIQWMDANINSVITPLATTPAPGKTNDGVTKQPPVVNAAGNTMIASEQSRWVSVMNNFCRVVYPLQGFRNNVADENKYPFINPDEKEGVDQMQSRVQVAASKLRELIEQECDHGDMLRWLKGKLLAYYKLDQDPIDVNGERADYILQLLKNQEDIYLKVQEVAYDYYTSLWLSLSRDEQKVLYDLATDGLVNYQNLDAINMLLLKGIFIYENGVLRVMNFSFKNFVLTRLQEKEVREIELESKQKGNWERMRLALVIVVITVGAFIFLTQQDAFNSMVAYLTAFSGGILALMKIISLLPSSSSSSK